MKLQQRWDRFEYSCIRSASYREGSLAISFADGTEAVADVAGLLPSRFQRPRWEEMSFSQHEVVVPTDDGEIEIPFDVIRRATDPEYAAHWKAIAGEYYGGKGLRLQELRHSRNLSLDDVAARSGIVVAELERIEQGDPDLVTAHTTRVLEAMGFGDDALIERPVSKRKRKTVA